MADFTLQALADTINNDPDNLGFKIDAVTWKGDQEIADLFNNADGLNPYTVNHTTVETGDIRAAVTFDGFDGLVTAEQAWFEWLTQNGVIPVNAHILQQLAGVPTANQSIWAVGERTEMNAALTALMQFVGTYAEFVWREGTTITASQVGQAANL